MKLILRTEPDAGETEPLVETIGAMGQSDWSFLMDMMGSLYDETEPKPVLDDKGDPVLVDGVPQYRPRTRQEVHSKIAAGFTKGIWAAAIKRKEELDLRAAKAAARPATVPAVPVTPAVI